MIPAEEGPIGLYPFTRPSVARLPLDASVGVWVVTDGVLTAGKRAGSESIDLAKSVEAIAATGQPAIDQAEALLSSAVTLDGGRPADDMSVVVLRVLAPERESHVRKMSVIVPAS